jgi:hypothetical protein
MKFSTLIVKLRKFGERGNRVTSLMQSGMYLSSASRACGISEADLEKAIGKRSIAFWDK